MKFLVIESSCDDTAVAVVSLVGDMYTVHASRRLSQAPEHEANNGVVPEVAARSHATAIMPLIKRCMDAAGCTRLDIGAIAVTEGPGLIPSLAVGVETARALGYAWGVPVMPVHHIWGHVVSGLLRADRQMQVEGGKAWNVGNLQLPILALVVSGGHSELLLYNGKKIVTLGRTIDDAAGEAFDKVATMLGLPYPGGPAIGELAQKGNENAFHFPRALQKKDTLDMSFSGLKTAVRYTLEDIERAGGIQAAEERKADVAASFQAAVVDVLMNRLERAVMQSQAATVMIGGGVSANGVLRQRVRTLQRKYEEIEWGFPDMEFTQDNAVMIGLAALLAPRDIRTSWKNLHPFSRMPLDSWL